MAYDKTEKRDDDWVIDYAKIELLLKIPSLATVPSAFSYVWYC